MSALGDRLRSRIAKEGPISFAAFMEAALYDEQDGFYAKGPSIGRGGAFATVPTLVPLFTRALAQDLRANGEALGKPEPFTVCEIGPGDGTLSAGLAEELKDIPL